MGQFHESHQGSRERSVVKNGIEERMEVRDDP